MVIFGRFPNDVVPLAYSFWGQSGWWTVPLGWFTRSVSGQVQCSPNSDFSLPLYDCKLNADGTLVFYDQMRNHLAGYDSPANVFP